MRVFMLGWEFPPFISGGLGTACYGLTKAMSAIGTDVLFIMPRPVSTPFSSHSRPLSKASAASPAIPNSEMRLDGFEHVVFRTIDAQLIDPYSSAQAYQERIEQRQSTRLAGPTQSIVPESPAAASLNLAKPSNEPAGDLFSEVQRYAALATEIGRNETFDVVHAHDWMTFPAGMAVAAARNVPFIAHVHSTEFDRSGWDVDPRIFDIERRGMHAAVKVIAVSDLTRTVISQKYGIELDKIEVVYNAIESVGNSFDEEKYKIKKGEKIVLFLGRITQQKGPDYFLAAAKKVLEVMDNVKFVMAGSGDLIRHTVELAAEMGIGHKVLFTGFLRGVDVERVFKMADLYVMPSVSEPFGIAPLEAMSHDVPVLISKQSGVSEVLTHALKCDFWDTDEMANKIVAVLKRPPLATTLREHASFEVRRFKWSDAARACTYIYESAVRLMQGKK